jgi:7,8-dihydropterin-6-yl-methyl-4-(beta-D-ribofuranosyl)aminobenzene 5'-phosphate synthase
MKTQILLLFTGLFLFLVAFCATNQEKAENISGIFDDRDAEQPEITLISVFDNYQVNQDMQTAWGFGCVIQTPDENILFDTGGGSDILLSNMQKMDIDPKSIDKVFISHIHGDHLGGLNGFLDKNNDVTVFIPASFPSSVGDMITGKGAQFKKLSDPGKISDFAWSTGELTGPPKEQSLMIHSKKGLIVMTGCAHPGVVRIVKKAKGLTGKEDVYLVVGGFHRPPGSTVQEFRELGVKKVAPTHCTGDEIRNAFTEEYGEDFVEYGVGKIVEIKQ